MKCPTSRGDSGLPTSMMRRPPPNQVAKTIVPAHALAELVRAEARAGRAR